MVSLKNKLYRKGIILKKKDSVNNDEIIARLYANLFITLKNSTLALAKHYDKQSTFLLEKLYELKDNEPPKIFRKTHKEWEQTVEKLEKQHDMAFNSYMEQCQELEELMKLAKIDN